MRDACATLPLPAYWGHARNTGRPPHSIGGRTTHSDVARHDPPIFGRGNACICSDPCSSPPLPPRRCARAAYFGECSVSPARLDYQPVVGYEQARLRLKTDRGRPSRYACTSCGGPAREWAYMGGCPNELTDGRPYSLDQSRYEPMCVSCHRRQDEATRDGRTIDVCPRGHSWAENTGIRIKRGPTTGLRFCKACHRENTARYRARLRETAA